MNYSLQSHRQCLGVLNLALAGRRTYSSVRDASLQLIQGGPVFRLAERQGLLDPTLHNSRSTIAGRELADWVIRHLITAQAFSLYINR